MKGQYFNDFLLGRDGAVKLTPLRRGVGIRWCGARTADGKMSIGNCPQYDFF